MNEWSALSIAQLRDSSHDLGGEGTDSLVVYSEGNFAKLVRPTGRVDIQNIEGRRPRRRRRRRRRRINRFSAFN